jgi:hypothetical protein
MKKIIWYSLVLLNFYFWGCDSGINRSWTGISSIAGMTFDFTLVINKNGEYTLEGSYGGFPHEERGTFKMIDENTLKISTTETKSKEDYSGSIFKLDGEELDWYLNSEDYFMTLR